MQNGLPGYRQAVADLLSVKGMAIQSPGFSGNKFATTSYF
jgi:hypothetical protein